MRMPRRPSVHVLIYALSVEKGGDRGCAVEQNWRGETGKAPLVPQLTDRSVERIWAVHSHI